MKKYQPLPWIPLLALLGLIGTLWYIPEVFALDLDRDEALKNAVNSANYTTQGIMAYLPHLTVLISGISGALAKSWVPVAVGFAILVLAKIASKYGEAAYTALI